MADKETYTSMSDLWDLVNTKSKQASAGKDKGTIGKNGGSSIIKEDGTITTAAGLYANTSINPKNGVITNKSLRNDISTVQHNITASDITINSHKLNSQLYELTNMKKVKNTAVGNLTMMGTVLVKTYDPVLEKWVLIRRQVRLPIFSNILDPFAIDDRLEMNTDGYKTYSYKIEKENNDDDADEYTNNSDDINNAEDSNNNKKTETSNDSIDTNYNYDDGNGNIDYREEKTYYDENGNVIGKHTTIKKVNTNK